VIGGGEVVAPDSTQAAMPIGSACKAFLDHVQVHSPAKPNTLRRYAKVLEHFERHLGGRRFVEAITRTDIDDYKAARSRERSQQHPDRIITPRTINFEISVLRTFFYFLAYERGLRMDNPCARFKSIRDPREKARRRPPTYSQDEIHRLLEGCDAFERAVFCTFLLTGLREQELCHLRWQDVMLRSGQASVRVTGEGQKCFSPKDYEEREIPIPDALAEMLRRLPREAKWVFATEKGSSSTHLLRRLKRVADRVGVEHATLHKFRHTYATRLLGSGCDIVTVQKLMGHSDIETTRQYLNPDDELKRRAVANLSFPIPS
jgi:integrase